MSLTEDHVLRDANRVAIQVGTTVENSSTVGYVASIRRNGRMEGLFQPHGDPMPEAVWVAGKALELHNPIPVLLDGLIAEWEE